MSDNALFSVKHLVDALVCLACGSSLVSEGGSVRCRSCGKAYPFDDGIYSIMADEPARPEPALYRDPNWRAYRERVVSHHTHYYRPGSLSHTFENMIKRDLLRLVENPRSPMVDLGCGSGSGFDIIGAQEEIVGIDINLGLLKECHRRYPRAALVHCDLLRSPFRHGAFPTIFSIGILEHIFYLDAFLEAVCDMLADDGRFYVLIPAEGGAAWSMMRALVTAPTYSRLLGVDYAQALTIEHCNTAAAIDSALRKFFIVEKLRLFPWRVGGFHPNLVANYRLRKRT